MEINELKEKCLFRYRNFNDNTVNEILTGNIWHSRHELLNDPFEFSFLFDWSEYDKASLAKINNHLRLIPNENLQILYLGNKIFLDSFEQQLRDEINRIIDKKISDINEESFVSCFASSVDNPLMWSHYSNGMTGLCIAYNEEKVKESDHFSHPIAINYVSTPEKIRYTDLSVKEHDFQIEEILFLKPQHAIRPAQVKLSFELQIDNCKFLIQKHNRWKYEGEIRNLIIEPKESGKQGISVNIGSGCIDAIIFGSKISKSNLIILELICMKNNIPMFKASPNKNDFSVVINRHIVK
ncbi:MULTISPECIES: DUF2971 domain-containing protein [Vibrio]|uniref:DUF2971 domain-containing protein n=1 Tax=Vibrio TaxID=662 RepID=UPI000C82DB61|nr:MULTISPECIES: DUF2971 domain-containing protein [Vibrio]PMN08324.1 hypothetical protein BCT39_14370 [Vibrio lentus]PTO70119.1 hypothetical protein CWN96_04295 [Vibrio splendidus]